MAEAKKKKSKATKTQMRLTGKQRLFIRYYLRFGEAKKAARYAGYSEQSIDSQSSQLMANPKVKSEINRMNKSLEKRLEITRAKVLREAELLKEESWAGIPIYAEDGETVSDIVGREPGLVARMLEFQSKVLGYISNNNNVNLNLNEGEKKKPSYRYDLDKLTTDEKRQLIVLLSKCRIKELPNPEDEGFDNTQTAQPIQQPQASLPESVQESKNNDAIDMDALFSG